MSQPLSPEQMRQDMASEHFALAYEIIFASIVTLLGILNLVSIALRRRSLSRVSNEQATAGLDDPEKTNFSSKNKTVPAFRHGGTRWMRFVSWCHQPLMPRFEESSWAFGASLNPIKIGIIFFLLSINLGFLLGVSTMVRPPINYKRNVSYMVILRAGHMALAQAPLVFALTGRNNIVQLITGFGYQQTRFVHKCAATAFIIFAFVHFVGMTGNSFHWNGKKGLKSLYALPIAKFGILTIVALFFISLTSLSVVRKHTYELFLCFHIALAIVVLVGVNYHAEPLRAFVYASISFWAFNRLLMFLQTFVSNPFTTSPVLHSPLIRAKAVYSHGAIILRIPFPKGQWSAGQHAYISFWDKSVLSHPSLIAQPHPFSIANIPIVSDVDAAAHDHEMMFIMRERNGMTKALANRLKKTGDKADLWVLMEGPYGKSHGVELYHEVLFVAGGSGITHIMSMLADLMHKAKLSSVAESSIVTRVSKVKLVWIIQNIEQSSWLRRELFDTVQRAHAAGVELEVAVYVTRGPLGVTPVASEENLVLDDEHATRERDSRQNSVSSSTQILGGAGDTTGTNLDQLLQHEPTGSKTSINRGRPPMDTIIGKFVSEVCGESLVAACGPIAVTSQVRSEVARLRTEHVVALDIASFEA